MKSSLPVALAHEAESKKSGVGPVGLHRSDSSPAALTQQGQTCALHWFPLQGYDVKCPLPWSSCLVPEMIQQKKYVSCCILHGGCLTLLQHPGSGSGFPASMMGWTPLTSEFLKNISPSIPVNAGMQVSGPLWVCSVSCSTDANGSLCQDVWLCTAQMLLLNSSKFSKTAWSSLASCPCSCTQAVSPSGPNAEAES